MPRDTAIAVTDLAFPVTPSEDWRANCRLLADVIEAGVFGFDMNDWIVPDPVCGTAGCIAGTAGAVFGLSRDKATRRVFSYEAAEVLGVPCLHESALFIPLMYGGPSVKTITATEAASVLRHYADTGEIKWRGKVLYRRED